MHVRLKMGELVRQEDNLTYKSRRALEIAQLSSPVKRATKPKRSRNAARAQRKAQRSARKKQR